MDDLGSKGDAEVSLPARPYSSPGLAVNARDNPPLRYPVRKWHLPERFHPS